jgi:hypothetical protein
MRGCAGHSYIGTEHILLGLLREGEGIAARVLESMGAEPTKIRNQVRPCRSWLGSRVSVTTETSRIHVFTSCADSSRVYARCSGCSHDWREPRTRWSRRGRFPEQQQDADSGRIWHQPHRPGGRGETLTRLKHSMCCPLGGGTFWHVFDCQAGWVIWNTCALPLLDVAKALSIDTASLS